MVSRVRGTTGSKFLQSTTSRFRKEGDEFYIVENISSTENRFDNTVSCFMKNVTLLQIKGILT